MIDVQGGKGDDNRLETCVWFLNCNLMYLSLHAHTIIPQLLPENYYYYLHYDYK